MMDSRPLRVCANHGCPELVERGYCDDCRPQQQAHRTGPAKHGWSYRWAHYSRQYRARHPYCRPCEQAGRVTATQAVDHIAPVSGRRDPLFWDPTNHQPICASCHGAKSAREKAISSGEGSFSNAHRATTSVRTKMTISEMGHPYDARP